ncbi:acyl-CoA carboxylase subunit epsilon [Streptomyces sp. NPDC059176]|uniref:acyl-CoA carboxylase subunit epsilon n=1 Tax=Streptomyces sp. NPDC059176 TaxID=3346758 RepID=UPI0036828DC4
MKILRGTPDHAELAALMTVLTMVASHREAPSAEAVEPRSRRAHWDRAWGGGFRPCGSWQVRDRRITVFDAGVR